MTPPSPRPLALLGAFLLGTGIALRLLVPGSVAPLPGAVPPMLLLAGAAVVLLDRALKRDGHTGRWPFLVALVPLPGLFPLEAAAVTRGIDLIAAAVTGLALRELVLGSHCRRALLRSLMALMGLLAMLALAQTLYQRAELREQVQELQARTADLPATPSARPDPILALRSRSGQAFLASDRASATFTNPNSFAGLLLLLLPLAVGRWEAGYRARIVLLLAALAFFAAGSLGSFLALLLCVPLVGVMEPDGPRWLRRTAYALGAIGLVGLVFLGLFAAEVWVPPAFLENKLATLQARIDYQGHALHLLPRMGPFGTGLESFGDLALEVQKPGDQWSYFAHSSFLQLLLELGPLFLVPLTLLVFGWRRWQGGRLDHAPERSASRTGLALQAGVLLGALTAPVLSLHGTLLPLGTKLASSAPLNGALNAAIMLWLLLPGRARPDAPPRAALAVALCAATLHQLVDFDLYSPGFAIGAACVLALVPRMGGVPAPSALRGGFGAVLLIAPLLVALSALGRDHRTVDLEGALRGRPDAPAPRAVLRDASESTPDTDLLPAQLQLARQARAWEEGMDLLAALPPSLRSRPSVRVAEAAWINALAADRPDMRTRVLLRLRSLTRPGEAVEAFILAELAVALARDGQREEAGLSARHALAAAGRWGHAPEELPHHELLVRLAGG